jgi:hypothetical protein
MEKGLMNRVVGMDANWVCVKNKKMSSPEIFIWEKEWANVEKPE